MHLELVLVGLAALTAAMPLDKRGDDSANQAQDINYKEYAGYRPYYQYGDYSSPAEAEAAKMQQGTFSRPPTFRTKALLTVQ